MFILKYYWNKDLFPYEEEQHMEMLVVFSISMFILDFGTGGLTFFFDTQRFPELYVTLCTCLREGF